VAEKFEGDKMSNKKRTVTAFNKDFFNDWTKIKKITPHFIEWTLQEDDEPYPKKWDEIEKIDIEFDNGNKLSIIADSNRPDDEDLCLCLKIIEYKGQEINWRVPKDE
jgi:hypothetical protein